MLRTSKCVQRFAMVLAGALLASCGGGRSSAPQLPVMFTPVDSVQKNYAKTHRGSQGRERPRYTITDLGTLGGSFSAGTGLNNQGWVTGSATTPGDQYFHAFLWQKGMMTDIGSSFGPLNSFTADAPTINDPGVVSGFYITDTPDPNGEDFCNGVPVNGTDICLPFVWRKGSATQLQLPGGNNAMPNQVNSRGEIVGVGEKGLPDPTCVPPQILDQVAVIWGPKKNQMRELPPYRNDTQASAIGVNDKGEVVGTSGKCKLFNQSFGYIEAVLWRDGQPINLGNLGFRLFNIGFSINNKSEVTGQASTPKTCCGGFHLFHAFLWRNGVMTDLGILPGDLSSLGNNINDRSQIVGLSETLSSTRGFLWQNGKMYDFNSLIPKHASFNVLETLGINNRGQVAGWGIPGNASSLHAFLATPCDAENPDLEGCRDARGDTAVIVPPEKVRLTLIRLNALHHTYWPAKAQR